MSISRRNGVKRESGPGAGTRRRVDLSARRFYNRGMEHLWAPWRIRYILGERETGCFFCRKSQESDDAKNLILIRERNCFALLNTFPYNAGHLMVAPYKHTGELDDLSEQELSEFMALTRCCKQWLAKALKPEGFNIGINLGRCPVRACSTTFTCTSSRGGTATRTSCPCWPTRTSSPRRWRNCMPSCERAWKAESGERKGIEE